MLGLLRLNMNDLPLQRSIPLPEKNSPKPPVVLSFIRHYPLYFIDAFFNVWIFMQNLNECAIWIWERRLSGMCYG